MVNLRQIYPARLSEQMAAVVDEFIWPSNFLEFSSSRENIVCYGIGFENQILDVGLRFL